MRVKFRVLWHSLFTIAEVQSALGREIWTLRLFHSKKRVKGISMKSIFLIIGAGNTRKSSLVRCLLGTDNQATQVEIRTLTGLNFRMRGLIGAAQAQGFLPGDWVNELDRQEHWSGAFPSVRNILATLRYDSEIVSGRRYPPGEEYVDVLIKAGWLVKGIVSLGEPAREWVRVSGLPNIAIPDSASIPSNTTAASVRGAFGWL